MGKLEAVEKQESCSNEQRSYGQGYLKKNHK